MGFSSNRLTNGHRRNSDRKENLLSRFKKTQIRTPTRYSSCNGFHRLSFSLAAEARSLVCTSKQNDWSPARYSHTASSSARRGSALFQEDEDLPAGRDPALKICTGGVCREHLRRLFFAPSGGHETQCGAEAPISFT